MRWLLLALAFVACGEPRGVAVVVLNDSGRTLTAARLDWEGDRALLGDLAPGERREVAMRARAESSVTLRFRDGPTELARAADVYLEPSSRGTLTLTLRPDASLAADWRPR